jgi:hypothetical protein
MGDEAFKEDMRNSYPDLHVTSLLGASNALFKGHPPRVLKV